MVFVVVAARFSKLACAQVENIILPMHRVTGIGGIFFRAKDPDGLAQWYFENLGVKLVPADYETPSWEQEAGPTVFAPFEMESDYFGDRSKNWMINFRVKDLDGMAAQLRERGIQVEVNPETFPNGRFARVHDPESNPIELWEPK
jgi:glyoxylase I family protein